MKTVKFTHFSTFWSFPELSALRVVISSGTLNGSALLKMGKIMVFDVQNVVPVGWQKTPKSGRCRKAYLNLEGEAKMAKPEVRRNPKKHHF